MKKLLFAFCFIVASFSANAELTPAQYATLKDDIAADIFLVEKPLNTAAERLKHSHLTLAMLKG